MIDISVVIPAFNEQHRIAKTLPMIMAYLRNHFRRFEVLVVDDGSDDDTALIAHSFSEQGVRLISFENNRGKGAAVRHGVLTSRGRMVLITDADLSTPIEELSKLMPHLIEAPLALGSRGLDDSRVQGPQPGYRRLMGWVFRQIVRAAGITTIRDTQCGFKLMNGPIARILFKEIVTEGFAFDVELIFLAQRRGLSFREVGVKWFNDPDSRVRPIIDSCSMLAELIRFRLHHADG